MRRIHRERSEFPSPFSVLLALSGRPLFDCCTIIPGSS